MMDIRTGLLLINFTARCVESLAVHPLSCTQDWVQFERGLSKAKFKFMVFGFITHRILLMLVSFLTEHLLMSASSLDSN